MLDVNTKKAKLLQYNNFWQNNLQSIDEISKELEVYLYRLEKRYSDFDSTYDYITNQINTLTSIYSSYNNLLGRDYLLKLKSLLKDYRKRHSYEGIDFNTIYYLHSKFDEQREKSFQNFPELTHKYDITEIPTEDSYKKLNLDDAAYKWITFHRNGSWFITSFKSIQIVTYEDADVSNKDVSTKSVKMIKINDKKYDVIDIFSQFPLKKDERPDYILIIRKHNIIKCFAATRIGKRIFAERDFISLNLKPIEKTSISPGRIRLFGKNHLYL